MAVIVLRCKPSGIIITVWKKIVLSGPPFLVHHLMTISGAYRLHDKQKQCWAERGVWGYLSWAGKDAVCVLPWHSALTEVLHLFQACTLACARCKLHFPFVQTSIAFIYGSRHGSVPPVAIVEGKYYNMMAVRKKTHARHSAKGISKLTTHGYLLDAM